MRIAIEYGRRQIELAIPRSRLRGVVEPKPVAAVADAEAAAERELAGTCVRAVTCFEDAWRLANLLCGRRAGVLVLRNARRLIVGGKP